MHRDAHDGQSGNVFYVIMIGIILFAALMFVFSKTARQGGGNIANKQTEMGADGLLDYAQTIGRGVNRVMSKGCSESQINFATPVNAAYPANADAPSDQSCDVFSLDGGAVSPMADASFGAGVLVRPSGGASLKDIGTWDTLAADPHQDLVLWFGPLPEALCRKLNTLTGFEGDPPVIATAQAWDFGAPNSGSLWGATVLDTGALAGRNSGCVNETAAPATGIYLAKGYQFYTVLLAR